MRFFYTSIFLMLLAQTLSAEPHKLLVSGNATLHRPADTFMLKVGVVTLDKTAEQAIAANNEKMQKILIALKKTGLNEKEFQTGNFTVMPKYAPAPREIPPDWQASISGYEVRNTLSIQTNKLNLSGPLIDAAAKEGANLFEDISFSLQSAQDAQVEAITQAVRQAYIYASAAVKEAGVTLGDILEININPAHITPHFYRAEKFAMAAVDTSTPISPGNVEVNASVSITYEIRHSSEAF